MPKTFQPVKGMRDYLPLDFKKFKFIIRKVRELFNVYNYQEINMPIVEEFDLIAKKQVKKSEKPCMYLKIKLTGL